jgi:hypothetical protein
MDELALAFPIEELFIAKFSFIFDYVSDCITSDSCNLRNSLARPRYRPPWSSDPRGMRRKLSRIASRS